MAWLELPTRTDLPAYSYNQQLEGVTYGVQFTFNDRSNIWTLGLFDALGNVLLAPVPMAINWSLFSRFVIPGLPPGKFYLFDTSGQGMDAGRFDLGDRCRLLYRESDT